jgi:hypothetical protein
MATGGGHFECLAGMSLTAHVGEIGRRRLVVDELLVGLVGPRLFALQGVDDLA